MNDTYTYDDLELVLIYGGEILFTEDGCVVIPNVWNGNE